MRYKCIKTLGNYFKKGDVYNIFNYDEDQYVVDRFWNMPDNFRIYKTWFKQNGSDFLKRISDLNKNTKVI